MPNDGHHRKTAKSAYELSWSLGVKPTRSTVTDRKLSQPLPSALRRRWTIEAAKRWKSGPTNHEKAVVLLKDSVERKLLSKRSSKSHREKDALQRRKGYTQKANVGGHQSLSAHRVNTKDGSLARIFIDFGTRKARGLPRGLIETICHRRVRGPCQYGVPLEEFVDAFHLHQVRTRRQWFRETTASKNADLYS